MIRTPELKTQAALLATQIQEALGTSLPHGRALDIVARLNGFKNWRHAVAEDKAPVKPATPAPQEEHSVRIVWGSDDTTAQEENGDPDTYNVSVETFATAAELAAYLKGIDDGNGWMDYNILDLNDMRDVVPKCYRKTLAAKLKAAGFEKTDEDTPEFTRQFKAGVYQFIIFQSDGENRFVNMDCSTDGGEYLTETPLFKGESWEEALDKALTVADDQVLEALRQLEANQTI